MNLWKCDPTILSSNLHDKEVNDMITLSGERGIPLSKLILIPLISFEYSNGKVFDKLLLGLSMIQGVQ